MKHILVLLFFIFFCWAGGMALAQQSIEFGSELASPNISPYPLVLSPAIDILPEGFDTITVGDEIFYYCNGIFYQKIMRDQKYAVVSAPIGAVVFSLPDGYQYMYVNGISYYVYQGVYYKRVLEGYRVIYPPLIL